MEFLIFSFSIDWNFIFKPAQKRIQPVAVWRVIDGRKPRFAGRLPILDDLFSQVSKIEN